MELTIKEQQRFNELQKIYPNGKVIFKPLLGFGEATEFKVHAYHVDPIILGWCETPQGFMIINECPKCGTKYRFHLSATINAKFSYEDFLQNFSLKLFLKQNKK